eukprot:COSAG01_NODE_69674_length_260_cov_1.937888_1_plen_37_part_01
MREQQQAGRAVGVGPIGYVCYMHVARGRTTAAATAPP